MTNLYRIILPVDDIDQATTFYSEVLETKGKRVSDGRHYFNCGNTILACYDPAADGDESPAPLWKPHYNQYIYFSVDNLEATLGRVRKAGGQNITGIQTMPWGERMFYASDSFGNPISFVDEDTVFRG